MKRQLSVFLPLYTEFPDDLVRRFRDDPGSWLPGPARAVGPGRWRITLRGVGLAREVECEVDEPWQAGPSVWRRAAWTPVPVPGDLVPVDKILPSFEGDVGLVRQGEDCSLVLAGAYDAPAAFLGAAADAMGLHRVARRTANQFLADVRSPLVDGTPVAVTP
ncbi:MAG: hypothetical protein R3320_00230 [Nitriliruptorales bacterium]|nr:hypothetical protein [Nitriliruptorales bacterium]